MKILFPKYIPAAPRYILLMYLENDKNKKLAAQLSGVKVRQVQKVVKRYELWLNGYKEASHRSLDA